MPAIAIAEGFNSVLQASPARAADAQHDTNGLHPITGKWRCEWNEGRAMEHVDLDRST